MKKLLILFVMILPISAYSSSLNDIINENIILDSKNKTIKDTEDRRFVNTAKIRFINKITAKSFTKNVEIGETIKFGELQISPLKCWKSYPEETPENKLLLKVFETNKNKEDKLIFYGWIFSSSPSISSIEHQTYDITLEDCNQL